MVSSNTESYRKIFKSTSLFGGVQLFNIIIAVVKSKLVALLIGPSGMGILGLLTSALGSINSITSFGLGTSAVKTISSQIDACDVSKTSKLISVVKKVFFVTGLLGMILSLIVAPWLSELTFGNKDYTCAFRWLSITLLLQQLSSGQMAIMQGFQKLRYLAKANVIGSFIGFLIAIPIYYLWNNKGIVPVIIATSIISMIFTGYFSQKVNFKTTLVSWKDLLFHSKEMLTMGFSISMSGLIATFVSYITRIYINKTGGIEAVGLYNAGFAIISTYVGMIFTAMVTDYYPRLSKTSSDNKKCKELINQQAEIALLIISPILIIFLIFSKFLIVMFYSTKFIEVTDMITWAALGMYLKSVSWSISIVILAKGKSKLYFLNELIANSYILTFNLVGYYLAGLEGLGISFFISYLFYLIQVYLLAKIKYSFSFSPVFQKIGILTASLGIICFLLVKYTPSTFSMIIGTLSLIISATFSFLELDKRIFLVEFIRNRIDRFI
jgi:O-antigen/teichoic acid export membrane protein